MKATPAGNSLPGAVKGNGTGGNLCRLTIQHPQAVAIMLQKAKGHVMPVWVQYDVIGTAYVHQQRLLVSATYLVGKRTSLPPVILRISTLVGVIEKYDFHTGIQKKNDPVSELKEIT